MGATASPISWSASLWCLTGPPTGSDSLRFLWFTETPISWSASLWRASRWCTTRPFLFACLWCTTDPAGSDSLRFLWSTETPSSWSASCLLLWEAAFWCPMSLSLSTDTFWFPRLKGRLCPSLGLGRTRDPSSLAIPCSLLAVMRPVTGHWAASTWVMDFQLETFLLNSCHIETRFSPRLNSDITQVTRPCGKLGDWGL